MFVNNYLYYTIFKEFFRESLIHLALIYHLSLEICYFLPLPYFQFLKLITLAFRNKKKATTDK